MEGRANAGDPLAGYACPEDWEHQPEPWGGCSSSGGSGSSGGGSGSGAGQQAALAAQLARQLELAEVPAWLCDRAARLRWLDMEVPLPFPLSWADEA